VTSYVGHIVLCSVPGLLSSQLAYIFRKSTVLLEHKQSMTNLIAKMQMTCIHRTCKLHLQGLHGQSQG